MAIKCHNIPSVSDNEINPPIMEANHLKSGLSVKTNSSRLLTDTSLVWDLKKMYLAKGF